MGFSPCSPQFSEFLLPFFLQSFWDTVEFGHLAAAFKKCEELNAGFTLQFNNW